MYLNFFTLLVIDFPAIAVSCYCLQRVRNNYHKTAGSKTWEAISWKENHPTFVWRWTLHYDDLEMWETLFENPIEATILHFIKELPNCWSWSIEIAKFRPQSATKLLRQYFGEQNNLSVPLPSPLDSKFGCLLFFPGSSYSGISSPSGGGWGKVSFNLFKGGKLLQRLFNQKRLKLRFVADYSFYIIEVQRCSN